MAKYGWKTEDEAEQHVKVVHARDYRELLDDPDVEAVIIALPLASARPRGHRGDAAGQARADREADGP